MTSLAHTPGRSSTVEHEAHRLGHLHAHVLREPGVGHVGEPTPNAKQPSAPAMQVCESVPATICPGSAISSITLLWQMASLPTLARRGLAVEA
jgi:hypothetical protein